MSDRGVEASRSLSAMALFAIVYATSAAAIYFSLGLVAERALGLTPLVFLAGGLFLGLAAMTYMEGALNHPEPGGSSAFARRAFNELLSFAAGWAVVLDFLVVIAIAAVTAANYLGTIWSPLGEGPGGTAVAAGVIAIAAGSSLISSRGGPGLGRLAVAIVDIAVQVLLVALGVAFVFDPALVLDSIDFGAQPRWHDVVYALTIVTVSFTGLEAAASVSPEARIKRGQAGRLVSLGVIVVVVLQVAVAAVALMALPVSSGSTELGGRWLEAPLVGVAAAIDPGGVGSWLDKAVAVTGFVGLAIAVRSAMFAVSRLAFSLTRHRQIPRIVGRLSRRWGTPWLIVLLTGLGSLLLALPAAVGMLAGIYAFGAMFAVTIAHLSVLRLRWEGGEQGPDWRMPLTVSIRGRSLALPAALGAVVSAAAFGTVVAMHEPARMVGGAWLLGGVLLYLLYRKLTGNPILRVVEVSERALLYEPERAAYGAILVPVLGGSLDDDIVQTAGSLAGSRRDDLEEEGAVIEAIWFHEIPMALPLDAPLPEAQIDEARDRLRRAKAVGEEYQGVTVETAQVRVRKVGEGIVREARRRGVEAIVLSTEGRPRAGMAVVLPGTAGAIGEVTRHVLRKAHCPVVVTVPGDAEARPPSGRG